MLEAHLMEVVRVALLELEGEGRYEVIDAGYVDGGWSARLLTPTNGAQTTVRVILDTQPRCFRVAVEGFKDQMYERGLV